MRRLINRSRWILISILGFILVYASNSHAQTTTLTNTCTHNSIEYTYSIPVTVTGSSVLSKGVKLTISVDYTDFWNKCWPDAAQDQAQYGPGCLGPGNNDTRGVDYGGLLGFVNGGSSNVIYTWTHDSVGCQPAGEYGGLNYGGYSYALAEDDYIRPVLVFEVETESLRDDPLELQMIFKTGPGPSTDGLWVTGSLGYFTILPSSPEVDLGGCHQCEAQLGAPINATNGNTWIEQSDYSIPGLGGDLTLSRTWNSLWPTISPIEQSGMFGDSWRSTFEERIQVLSDTNTAKWWLNNGAAWTFSYDPNTALYTLIEPVNERASLSFDASTALFTLTLSDGSKRIFTNDGYLWKTLDRNGNAAVVTYDQSKRIASVADAAGRSIYFSYGDPNFVRLATSVSDSAGIVANYSYDLNGRLSQVSYPDGSAYNFVYDANSLISTVQDSLGAVLESHTYDAYRRGLTSERANGIEHVSLSYPVGTGQAVGTDSNGNTTQYSYQKIGKRRFITSVNGPGCATCGGRGVETFAYDSAGNRTSSTDSLNRNITYTYDSAGNVLTRSQIVSGVRLTWNYTYNGFNQILTATDPLGHVTTNTYDSNGNLLTTTSPGSGNKAGSTTTFTYDAKGQLIQIKDPLNHLTTLTYSLEGLVRTVTDALNNVTTYEYDGRGNRTAIIDALSNRTTYEYDARNRVKKVTLPDLTTTSFVYDARGRRTSVTDGNNKTTSYSYDDADRLTAVTDANTGVVSYGYDAEDNLTSITDALNHATSFSYDAQGRVLQTTFPSTKTESYTYDTEGNLLTKTNRRNQTISYTYDELNRVTKKQYPDATTVNYTYDGDGRLTQVTDPSGTYAFAYDNMDRLTGTTTTYSFLLGKSFSTAYTYDAASNRTGLTGSNRDSLTYTYDVLNRLTTLKDYNRNSFGFSYDSIGRRASLTRPNSITTTYAYDAVSNLLSILHKSSGGTVLDGASYTYGSAGERASKTSKLNNLTSAYGYDPVYQLLSTTQSGNSVENFTYDLAGNRLSSLGVPVYAYNESNQLNSAGPAAFTYDDDGNTLTKSDASGTTQFAWDFEDRLVSLTPPGASSVNFTYDPFGRRIRKGNTIYIYDGADLIQESDASGNLVARYVFAGIDQPLVAYRGTATEFYQADGLGSITSLSSKTGTLDSSFQYGSYGDLVSSTGSFVQPFRYTGREFDGETSLYYYRARYYSTDHGRFLNEDSSGFGGINFYSYGENSPTNFIDPTGLQGVLGPNPTPPMSGHDLEAFNSALEAAKAATCEKNCDGALQDFKIKSLASLVNQMAANVNVYDGRKSTYPLGKETVSKFLAKGTAGAVAFPDVELTFIGDYFWNPTSIQNITQQRALILLHEAVHEFGHVGDAEFGGSGKLSKAIAEKCFPALTALKELGSLTH